MQATFKVYIKMHWNQSGKLEVFDTSMHDIMENDDENVDEDEDESDEENEEPIVDKNNNKAVKEKGKGSLLYSEFFLYL